MQEELRQAGLEGPMTMREEPRNQIQDVPTAPAPMRRQEMLSNYEINIKFLSVGCVVRVGCKDIAFTTVREAMTALNDYVKNPHGESERWWKIFSEQE